MIATDRVFSPFAEEGFTFDHGFTFAGHPGGCAAALASLDLYEAHAINEHVRANEVQLGEMLESLRDIPIVGDVRRAGHFGRWKLVKSRETQETLFVWGNEELLGRLFNACARRARVFLQMGHTRRSDRAAGAALDRGATEITEIESVLRPCARGSLPSARLLNRSRPELRAGRPRGQGSFPSRGSKRRPRHSVQTAAETVRSPAASLHPDGRIQLVADARVRAARHRQRQQNQNRHHSLDMPRLVCETKEAVSLEQLTLHQAGRRPFPSCLERRTAETPDSKARVAPGGELTFADWHRHATATAAPLSDRLGPLRGAASTSFGWATMTRATSPSS